MALRIEYRKLEMYLNIWWEIIKLYYVNGIIFGSIELSGDNLNIDKEEHASCLVVKLAGEFEFEIGECEE